MREELINYLVLNSGKPEDRTWKEVGKEFGLKAEVARGIWYKYRQKNSIPDNGKIKTIKTWETYNGTVRKSITYDVVEDRQQKIEDFLKDYTSTYKPLSIEDVLLNDVYNEKCSAFIDITDFHLDKKELTGKTPEEKISNYKKIVDSLIFKAYKAHRLEEIVFVIGSDYFHTDTFFGTTTNGTPLDVNLDWNKAYELGFDLMAYIIQRLSQFCELLKVILVSGNHDRTKSFYMAHGLSKLFASNKSITFDNSIAARKVYVYGNTFIGLHHGNCKIDQLPLIFAKEYCEQWGKCKYHEIKVGDKHFYFEKEIAGVRIKQLPSLSDSDRWHDDNNFVQNIRAGICTVYDLSKGKVTEFEERL